MVAERTNVCADTNLLLHPEGVMPKGGALQPPESLP